MHYSADRGSDLLQGLYDLCKGWPTRRLHMPTLVDELQKTLVVPVVGAQLLSALYFSTNLARLEAIEGDSALHGFPQESAEGEHVHLLVVLSLLKEFGSHVARSSRELHRSRSQIGNKPGKAKVTHFDIEVGVDEHVVTLNVAMHDSQIVHVEVNSGAVQGDLHSQLH